MGSATRYLLQWAVLIGVVCSGWSGVAWSAEITQRLPSGLVAHADYRQGQNNKPAVLVLHGFMTTQNFGIVRTIAGELNEQGYTVLAPTLTLEIDQRRSGLACEAIHTHTMENDLAELGWWTQWLAARHPGPIVLVGHSSGSLQVIAYAATQPEVPLAAVVATSPIYFGQDYSPSLTETQIVRARQRIDEASPGLDRYALTFCDHSFVATPQSYLSYAGWDRTRSLEALRRVSVPVRVVIGSADSRATPAWSESLREAGADVTVLEGATHFFDATHEFELLDVIAGVLGSVGAGGQGRVP